MIRSTGQYYPVKAAALTLRGCCLFLLLAADTFVPAHADQIKELSCRQVGVQAQAIAEARDQGKSIEEILAALPSAVDSDQKKAIIEAGNLLFHQFRQMTPEAAAFEFYMDCLDSD